MATTLDPKQEELNYFTELYGIMVSQDDAINKILDDANKKISKLVTESSLNKPNLATLIGDIIALALFSMASEIKKSNKALTELQIKTEAKKLSGADNKQFIKDNKKLPTKIEKTILTRPQAKSTTSKRFKTILTSAQKTVKNIIAVGIKNNKDAFQIGKDIQFYLKPEAKGTKVSPYKFYRQMTGKTDVPKNLRSGSVQYNALRIARTEIATTMRENIVEMYQNVDTLKGYKWELSFSHPRPDICDLYAEHDQGLGIGVWRVPPGTPHANCMCKVIPILKGG